MRRLSSIVLSLVLTVSLYAQKSPHGEKFFVNCDDCHKTDGWKVDLKTISFDHGDTKFPLVGQHQDVSCKQCHTSLEFAKAPNECNACHTDMHEQTVGLECERCHTPNSWIVTNITKLHQQSRFPLIGPHNTAECKDCHINLLPSSSGTTSPTASRLRFDPLGIECYDCHKANYLATTQPNHAASNYSTNCTECHNINSFEWKGAGVNHNFFPLTGGHAINDCAKCHTSGVFAGLSTDCFSCHQPNYLATTNPNHSSLNFPTDCKICHTTNPGWKPADYRDHRFPIYSGNHNQGVWNTCTECHTNPSDYSQFTCIDCHEHSNKSDVDNEHEDVQGYAYNSPACYACHPTGTGEGSFDHAAAGFPLASGHASVDCAKCHTSGFSNTSALCTNCLTYTYKQTINPNHNSVGISNNCASCHTLDPGWNPATFPNHNDKYVIAGAHITSSCADCHSGNYNNTPNTCAGCHMAKYNQTTNPNHAAVQFPSTCADCHSQVAWTPATFDHDGQFFPIYSGKHKNQWNACADCHTNPSNYSVFTCTTAACHSQSETNNEHQGVGGYQYNSGACLNCHPNGSAQTFDHAAAGFPLTGGHSTVLCSSCHTNGYVGTSTVCANCHTARYNQTSNPNHTAIGISTDCATCHTLNPGWNPATFPTHNGYYAIEGAHVAITNQCVLCHNGNYNTTPNTCAGCHMNDYNQTNDPNHIAAQFPTSCTDCHTQTAWSPSTFDHDGQYFPIYSGKHNNEWNSCSDCHTNPSNYAIYTCTGSCHPQSSTNNEHQGIGGYQYVSSACLACHPNGSAEGAFDHNTSSFPLTGGHSNVECASCHPNGYNNTSSVCASCHTDNYNQTTNPNHVAINIPNDCITCHTTNPGWAPATFPIHNNYYVIAGAHVPIANQCADCHNGNYNSTPNTCAGCHMDNYNQTTNPNHATSGFSTECASCHSQTSWVPSTFNHENVYPLTGAHASIATNCLLCHPTGYSNTPNTCVGCHQNNYNQSTNPNHSALSIPTECVTCHTTNPGWTPATFPIHNNYYLLEGAHVNATCAACHNGNYNNTPNTCAGCHTNDYNQTTDPNHASAQFPTTCADCHSQNAWTPSTFNHDGQYFPIYSGTHENKWNTCSACHPNPSNFAVFTCTTSCHPQSSTNNDHQGVGGYQYVSSACLACHPNGDQMIRNLMKSN